MKTIWRPEHMAGLIMASLLIAGLDGTARAEQVEPLGEPESPAGEGGGAEEVPDPEQAAVLEARLHFQQGLRLVRRSNWEPALAEFEESLRIFPTAVALFNRGLCLRYLNRYPESIVAFTEYLERYAGEIDAGRRADVEVMMREMRALLNEVTVNVNVDGAVVSIDSLDVGESPLASPVFLTSGMHAIEVRLQGYRTGRREITVVAGRDMTVDFELVAPPRRGRLRVETNVNGAAVLVDGEEVGVSPYVGMFDEGEHEIAVQADGYRSTSQVVSITADDDRIVTVVLSSTRVHRAWFWSMIGLTGVAALATAGLGIGVMSAQESYDPMGSDAYDRYDQGRALITGADVSLGLTCTFAAAALVLAFFTDFRGEGAPSAVVLSDPQLEGATE